MRYASLTPAPFPNASLETIHPDHRTSVVISFKSHDLSSLVVLKLFSVLPFGVGRISTGILLEFGIDAFFGKKSSHLISLRI